MKKILKKIEWIIDYYFIIWLYSPKKLERYVEYMENKWGKKNVLAYIMKRKKLIRR